MVTRPSFKDFYKNGYFIYKIKNKKDLNFLKKKLFLGSKSMVSEKIQISNFLIIFIKSN